MLQCGSRRLPDPESGETTAVVFTALPGEDGDYTVRIGTDSFETTGVIMAMMPGTVEDLEHIKGFKGSKGYMAGCRG